MELWAKELPGQVWSFFMAGTSLGNSRLPSSILFSFLGSWVPSILQLTLQSIYFFVRGLLKSLELGQQDGDL